MIVFEQLAVVALEGPPGCALFDLSGLPQSPQFLGYDDDDGFASVLGGALQRRGDLLVGLLVAPNQVIPITVDAQQQVTLGSALMLRDAGEVAPDAAGGARGRVLLDGDIAFVSDPSSEVFVLDTTEAMQPRLLGQTAGIASPQGMQRIGDRYLVVADAANGVVLVDIDDRQRPTVLNLARGGTSIELSVDAPYVYSAGEFPIHVYKMFSASEF